MPAGAHADAVAPWTYTFADPAGDAGAAPDIAALRIGADDSGQAIFHVSVALSPTDTTSIVSIFIDADHNAATGDASLDGAEYELDLFQSNGSYYFWLFEYDLSPLQLTLAAFKSVPGAGQ